MWLSLFLIALIAAITYMQALHGLFSALIHCVLTILCLAFAFAIHEYVAFTLLLQWKPDFAIPLALILSFSVPLIILRVTADAMIRRSCLLPSMFDRVGGAVFGLVSALAIVGVLAISLQLLPFGGSFLGFQRMDRTAYDPAKPTESGLWLGPDRFAAGMASYLSTGIFSGKREWRTDHVDFVQEIAWSQTVPRGVRCLAPPDAIQIQSVDASVSAPYILQKESFTSKERPEPIEDRIAPGHKLLAIRFTPTRDAMDVDERHRFTLFQIRLVGDDRGVASHYHPIAFQDETLHLYVTGWKAGNKEKSALGELYTVGPSGIIDVAFEIPTSFTPRFLEYKMGAQAPVSESTEPAEPDDEGEKPDEKSARAPEPSPETDATEQPAAPPRPGGRTHGANVAGAGFSDELPHRMTDYQPVGDAEIHESVMQSGHIIGLSKAQGDTGGVTRFEVPEGKALLQIDAVNLRAGSILGHAKSFAVKSVRNYLVTDDAGAQYKICGQIAVADVGAERYVEVQYYPEVIGSIGGVKDFSRIKDRHLKGANYELYFLFLIDSGRKVTNFSTLGTRGGEDLREFDLVAP